MGNYDQRRRIKPLPSIIPQREKMGNYDASPSKVFAGIDYTTTREDGELRRSDVGW